MGVWGGEVDKIGKGGQKFQTFDSYKISKSQGGNVQHNNYIGKRFWWKF